MPCPAQGITLSTSTGLSPATVTWLIPHPYLGADRGQGRPELCLLQGCWCELWGCNT